MTRYADIPKPIRSGIVIVDPQRGTPQRIIVLQFNPDSLERTLALQTAGAEGAGDRTEALRLKRPAVETWKFTAEIDAARQRPEIQEQARGVNVDVGARSAQEVTCIKQCPSVNVGVWGIGQAEYDERKEAGALLPGQTRPWYHYGGRQGPQGFRDDVIENIVQSLSLNGLLLEDGLEEVTYESLRRKFREMLTDPGVGAPNIQHRRALVLREAVCVT
ncbi:hypothetical protein [Streptomyces litchfieldiae]|uniref:Uncharacterized protein n=1 Tax=Streptomyces litchfieldiae TaxID=3075543 RepID=A0ABU2MNJ4_9ACTN|nr:hypothetical protein [Streptomyces sp. DSM 44938]MDT0343192.1 hypothetical protein [Streptomyces sp. DSM 44938]